MVEYRLANEDDYEKINAFYNRIYKENRTAEQFLWEFRDGPFGKSIYVVAEDDGKIIGTNCVIPIDLIDANKKIIKSGKSEDTLVDPEYRGQQIFYKIYEFLFEKCKEANIQVIWGFTSAKKPFEKLGFDVPYSHEQSLAVRDIWKAYTYLSSLNPKNALTDKIKILGLSVLSRLKTLGRIEQKNIVYKVKVNCQINTGVDELILKNQTISNSLFSIHQTPEFQDWRIYNNPNFYKVHTYSVYSKTEELMALIVFNSHPNQVAYICQSTFHPDLKMREKVEILQSVTHMLFKTGIKLVRNWVFKTNKVNIQEATIQNRAGYINIQRGIGLVWKNLSSVDIEPENFYLSRIATQGVI